MSSKLRARAGENLVWILNDSPPGCGGIKKFDFGRKMVR